MRKFFKFILYFINKTEENELLYFANALTYKILLALFPFIIFLMTLLGFFDLDFEEQVRNIIISMPNEIKDIFSVFMEEVIYTKNISLLSFSLFISIYSASSGFTYMIKGLNKVYSLEEKRNFIQIRAVSVLLVLIFAFIIAGSLVLFIFGDAIKDFLIDFVDFSDMLNEVFSFTSYIANIAVIFILLIIIHKISICRKLSLKQLMPGTLITVAGWLVMNKIFNLYVNNFAKYSKVYGSIGSIFLLLIWLNIISLLILFGSQFNAILLERSEMKCGK